MDKKSAPPDSLESDDREGNPMHTIRQSTGVYYFQRRIPLALQSDFGKTKFVFSLKTKNRETAKAQARIHSVELDSKFQAIHSDS